MSAAAILLLAGRVALVTGAVRGLGRSIAHAFAQAGALGTALDLDQALAAEAAPPGWDAAGADVRDPGQIEGVVAETVRRFGTLDVVVANAGVVPPWRQTEEIDFTEWDEAFAVNVRGVAATIRAAVPAMRGAGGSIIVMGSLNSWRGHARQCLYTATKHAVLGIVRATALDLGRYGIRVNALAPGPVATDALLGRIRARAAAGGRAAEEALGELAAATALGRMAMPGDVANAAVYLASGLSAGQTGLLFPVDGGLA